LILGINQISLLIKCYKQGNITVRDVSIYYNRGITEDSKQYLLGVLEKLENQDLLYKINNYSWGLTDQGKQLLIERNKIKNNTGVCK